MNRVKANKASSRSLYTEPLAGLMMPLLESRHPGFRNRDVVLVCFDLHQGLDSLVLV